MQLSDYKILIADNTNLLSIKLPIGQSNLQITQTTLKLNDEYLLLQCKSPNTNYEFSFGGYSIPTKKKYFLKINKQLKIIYLIKIKKMFILCQIFPKQSVFDCELEDERSRGVVFYQQKLFLDEGRSVEYKYGDLNISSVSEYVRDIERVELCPINMYQLIYKARIVNYCILKKIYYEKFYHTTNIINNANPIEFTNTNISTNTDINNRDIIGTNNNRDNLLSIILEMCIYFEGRFILKNKFYATNLQKKRINLLNSFKKSKIISLNTAILILDRDIFLLEEIAIRKGNSYSLKGFYENLEIEEQELELFNEKERVISLLRKQTFTNSTQLIERTGLTFKQIMNCVDESIFYLSNNTFTLKTECELTNVFLQMYKTKKSYRKSELVKELEGKYRIEDINRVANVYCELKGPNWVLRE